MARKRKPKFRSQGERDFADYLTRKGVKWDYESEKLQYLSDYNPDFIIEREDKSKLYIEFKGYLKPTDRSKMIKVKKLNPNADIRIVFQRAGNKLNKNSSTTYWQWAEKNGFPWSENEVPKTWLNISHPKGRRK
jgi:hypothetical protein